MLNSHVIAQSSVCQYTADGTPYDHAPHETHTFCAFPSCVRRSIVLYNCLNLDLLMRVDIARQLEAALITARSYSTLSPVGS